MKGVGIERSVSDIHRLIAHGLKTRCPRSAVQALAGLVPEARGGGAPRLYGTGIEDLQSSGQRVLGERAGEYYYIVNCHGLW